MTEVNYNDGKWHGWNGGECPVHPETIVEVSHKTSGFVSGEEAEQFYWDGDKCMIVAFRVIKEHKDPRDVWIGIDANGNCHFFDKMPDEFVTGWREGKNLTKYREVLE